MILLIIYLIAIEKSKLKTQERMIVSVWSLFRSVDGAEEMFDWCVVGKLSRVGCGKIDFFDQQQAPAPRVVNNNSQHFLFCRTARTSTSSSSTEQLEYRIERTHYLSFPTVARLTQLQQNLRVEVKSHTAQRKNMQ